MSFPVYLFYFIYSHFTSISKLITVVSWPSGGLLSHFDVSLPTWKLPQSVTSLRFAQRLGASPAMLMPLASVWVPAYTQQKHRTWYEFILFLFTHIFGESQHVWSLTLDSSSSNIHGKKSVSLMTSRAKKRNHSTINDNKRIRFLLCIKFKRLLRLHKQWTTNTNQPF